MYYVVVIPKTAKSELCMRTFSLVLLKKWVLAALVTAQVRCS